MGALATGPGLVIGRYVVFDEIASGGMATVHLGRLRGAVGFARTVAIKRLHTGLARDEEFTAMFLDEARLAARIRHPNVVQVLDVVHEGGELFLVMDYVQGESLARLVRAVRPGMIPPRIAVAIMASVLHGLHAAHEATSEHGQPLEIVHRDVSPQNVLVGTDGVARVLDFGVAKAANRIQTTRDGSVKGKIAYMAPEQLLSESVDRRADIYAAAVVLWEAITAERLFDGDNQGRVVRKILDEPVPIPSTKVPGLPKTLDDAVMRGLDRDVKNRWQTAREFASALERCLVPAPPTEIGEWVESIGGGPLLERLRRVKEIESRSEVLGTITPAREETPTMVERERSSKRPNDIAPKATVPAAFPVMAPRTPSEPPLQHDITIPSDQPPEPVEPSSGARILSETPKTPSQSAKLQIPSPFAPMAVQTIAVTPIAKLDASSVPAPPPPRTSDLSEDELATVPKGGSRMGIVIVVAIVVLLAAAGAFRLWHR
jgi:serine/threonine-protein kinase